MDMWRCFTCGQLNADLRMECLACGQNPADCQRGTVKMPWDPEPTDNSNVVENSPERKLPKKVPGCNCGYCNPPKQPEPKVKTEDLLHPCSSYLPGDDGETVEQEPALDSNIRLFLKDPDQWRRLPLTDKDDLSLNPKSQGSAGGLEEADESLHDAIEGAGLGSGTGKEEFNIRLCPKCGAMSDKAHRDVCGTGVHVKGECLDCDGIGCSRCIDMSGTNVSTPTLWFNVTRDGSSYELAIGDEVYLYNTLWEVVRKIHDKLMLM